MLREILRAKKNYSPWHHANKIYDSEKKKWQHRDPFHVNELPSLLTWNIVLSFFCVATSNDRILYQDVLFYTPWKIRERDNISDQLNVTLSISLYPDYFASVLVFNPLFFLSIVSACPYPIYMYFTMQLWRYAYTYMLPSIMLLRIHHSCRGCDISMSRLKSNSEISEFDNLSYCLYTVNRISPCLNLFDIELSFFFFFSLNFCQLYDIDRLYNILCF